MKTAALFLFLAGVLVGQVPKPTQSNYLIAQGVRASTVSAIGMGKPNPVASNDRATGRQRNRRVEMVVTGGPIGISVRSL